MNKKRVLDCLWISGGGVTLVGDAISIDEEPCEAPLDFTKIAKKQEVDLKSKMPMIATHEVKSQ